MKKWKSCLSGLVILCCVGVFAANPAFGDTISTATSTTTIDWSTLSFDSSRITFIDNAEMESFSGATVTGNPTVEDLQQGWGNTNASTSSGSSASADSFTTANLLSAEADVIALFGESYSAVAEAKRGAVFQVSGTGDITISLNYNLSYSTGPNGDVYAASQAWAYLHIWDGSAWQVIDIFNDYLVSTALNDSDSRGGILSAAGAFQNGQYGYFDGGVYSEASAIAPVPVPPSLLLLGSGLIGLIGFRRKFRN